MAIHLLASAHYLFSSGAQLRNVGVWWAFMRETLPTASVYRRHRQWTRSHFPHRCHSTTFSFYLSHQIPPDLSDVFGISFQECLGSTMGWLGAGYGDCSGTSALPSAPTDPPRGETPSKDASCLLSRCRLRIPFPLLAIFPVPESPSTTAPWFLCRLLRCFCGSCGGLQLSSLNLQALFCF